MNEQDLHQRLSRITTHWTMLFQAHQGEADAVSAAQRVLMGRYAGAVYRYLLGITHDPDAADELAQEFALRFLQGDFRRADPERGRFRDFVKMALRHLVVDHHRRQENRPRALPLADLELAARPLEETDSDRQFLASWQTELLARAWEGLARLERETGQPFYTVLRFRADHPDVRSGPMAEQLSSKLGKPLTAGGIRQLLHRAREKFAVLLLEDVAHSLDQPTREQLEQELLDLGLLEHCKPALERIA